MPFDHPCAFPDDIDYQGHPLFPLSGSWCFFIVVATIRVGHRTQIPLSGFELKSFILLSGFYG